MPVDGLGYTPRPPRPAPPPAPPLAPQKSWRLPQFASLHAVSAGIAAALIAIGIIAALPRQSHFDPAPAAVAAATGTPQATAPPTAAPATQHQPAAPTDRLHIPTLGINAPIIHIGLVDGQLDAPKTLYQVGWYQDGPWPGQPGTAIIDGHSGAPGQVGVFEHLDRLKPGSVIAVTTAAGASTNFVVRTSGTFPANQATANRFFAKTLKPTLNLISCYGTWDAATRSYDQRWIVTASLDK